MRALWQATMSSRRALSQTSTGELVRFVVYRKLDVDSRVTLTRLLLGAGPTR